MRDGWKALPLSDVLEHTIGGVWGGESGTDEVEVTVVRSTEFTKRGYLDFGTGVSRSIKHSQLKSRELKEGDILLEKSGGGPDQPVGRVVYVTAQIPNKFVCSNFVQLVRPNSMIIEPLLLFHIMWQWHTINRTLEFQAQTTGIRNLRTPDYLDQEIYLPPLPEQKRIVDLISSVDSYIESLQQQLESAKRSRNAVLHELLTTGGDDWEKTTLGDIANWSGGITPSMANLEFWEGGNIPWISSGDIATYESEGTKKNVTQKALSETSLKLLPSGTVIIVVRSGILIHSLPVAILRAPATINQDIKAAQPKKGTRPEFLWFLLRYLEKEILSTCRKTGTTVQSIGTEALLGTKIKLPPMSVQESICEVVSAMDLVTNQSEKLIIEAKNLRSGLLSDLLSGVHEIPASYDKVIGAA